MNENIEKAIQEEARKVIDEAIKEMEAGQKQATATELDQLKKDYQEVNNLAEKIALKNKIHKLEKDLS